MDRSKRDKLLWGNKATRYTVGHPNYCSIFWIWCLIMLIKFILHHQQHQQDKSESESDRLESLSINNAVKELTY